MTDEEKKPRITKSGDIDKRCTRSIGNNGVKRGPDKKPRKKPTGYYTLKDEVRAMLRYRMEKLIEFFGSPHNTTKALGVTHQQIQQWRRDGKVSIPGCRKAQNFYKKNKGAGYTARWLRPDLKFDCNGKALEKRCTKFEMMVVVK